MSVLGSTLGVWAVALLLLLVAGYGPSRWLTPPALQPYELLLVPLWGYGLLVFVAYYGLNTALNLRAALLVTLTIAALLALWRLMRPGESARWPRAPLGESLAVGLIALLAGLLGVVPLIRADYLLPIGHGWDTEFYLPLAAYLQDYTYATLDRAPPAPLLNVIRVEPTSVRAIGFSYFHGTVDLLGGWSPVGTFPLLLALIQALAVIPVYLLLRVGLAAGRPGAALGALLVAANSLLLWISYNNFAMHVSSMPLIPLAVLLALLALAPRSHDARGQASGVRGQASARSNIQPRGPRRDEANIGLIQRPTTDIHNQEIQPLAAGIRRSLALRVLGSSGLRVSLAGAIAATTMLTLSYHPALLAYGALAGGVGLWALIVNRDKLATIGRGVAIMLGCLVLGGLAHWRAPVAFFDVYAARTPSLGGDRFARPTELLGVETFHHLPLAVDDPAWFAPIPWLALSALALLILIALWRGAVKRGPTVALLALALLYALGLRYVIAFPYGYYKGVSYLSFAPLAIAGAGLGALLGDSPPRRASLRAPLLGAGLALGALVLGATGWSTYRLLATYDRPALAGGDVAALAAAARDLPPGTVELVDHPELRGPPLGFVAMGLYGHPWIGRGQTGFALFYHPAPGTQARYALMHRDEDPRAWGFESSGAILHARSMVMYRAPEGAVAFLSGGDAAYAPPRGSLHDRLDSLQVQNLTHGDYRVATADSPLWLYAAADRLSWEPLAGADSQPRVLRLDVASDVAQAVTIRHESSAVTYRVARGVNRLTTDRFESPATIEIAAEAPLVVRSAHLFEAGEHLKPGVESLEDTLLLRTTTTPAGESVSTMIEAISADADVVHLGLELYEITQQTPRRYAGGQLAVRANEPARLMLDLREPAAALNGGPIALDSGSIVDGEYFAALWIYHGATLAGRMPFVRFERRDGAITAITPLDANASFVRLPAADHQVDVSFGSVSLRGYTLDPPESFAPGARLRLSLDWEAHEASTDPLLVFAQVLASDDHKWAAWDGAAGGDWWPSPAWQAGDRIRQDVPLALDPATPPGRYRLAVGLYHAATGARLAATSAPDGLVVLQEIEVRDSDQQTR